MEIKDWIAVALTVWANILSTIALIMSILQSKKKTAKVKPRKAKHKR